jgi:putative oxidoreductase
MTTSTAPQSGTFEDSKVFSAVLLVARIGLGILFVVAGAAKVRAPSAFAIEIVNYRFLPELAPYLAVALPPLEILTGLTLVAAPAVWRRAAAVCATGLLLMFTVAVTSAVARGMDISCGCFGGASESVTWLTVLRDLLLLAAAAAVVIFPRMRPREGAAALSK